MKETNAIIRKLTWELHELDSNTDFTIINYLALLTWNKFIYIAEPHFFFPSYIKSWVNDFLNYIQISHFIIVKSPEKCLLTGVHDIWKQRIWRKIDEEKKKRWTAIINLFK